jgi:cytoskeletal protein CcmA (bactofilin family)
MKRLLGSLCVAAMALTASVGAMADEKTEGSEGLEKPHQQQRLERRFGGDLFAASNQLLVSQPVAGDLIAGGGQVEVKADVGGDAIIMGGSLRLDGDVTESLFLAGGQVVVNGKAGRNARVGGGQVEFGPSSQVGGNLSVGGGDVALKGRVNGYLQAAGGKVLIDGVVAGDVEARAGELTLGPNARITGKLRYASREPLQRDPAAQVQGDVERIGIPGGWPVPEEVERRVRGSVSGSASWIWTVGLLVVAGAMAAALPGFTERVATIWRNRFPMSLLLGFVLMVCLPVVAVLFLATLIGVPLGLLTLAAYPILLVLGYVSSGMALGVWASTGLNHPLGRGGAGRVAAAVLGMLAIGLLARLPFLGGPVMGLALLAGLGALALQFWRSNRPTS